MIFVLQHHQSFSYEISWKSGNSWYTFPRSPREPPGLLTFVHKLVLLSRQLVPTWRMGAQLHTFRDGLTGSTRLEVLGQLHKPGRTTEACSYIAGRVGLQGFMKQPHPLPGISSEPLLLSLGFSSRCPFLVVSCIHLVLTCLSDLSLDHPRPSNLFL